MITGVLDQRQRFVDDLQTARWTMSELCARYGISRPTGYLWHARYRAQGPAGLEPRSSAPHACPHQTPTAIVTAVLAARRRYGWGAKKLRHWLQAQAPEVEWPARSTDQRHPRPRADVAEAAPPSHLDASRARGDRLRGAQRCLARGLQRAVQDGRWAVLLSADRDGSLQSAGPGLSRVGGDHRGRHPGRVPAALSCLRATAGDAHRQRDAVRGPGPPGPVRPECVVAATRDRASTDSARLSAGEREP